MTSLVFTGQQQFFFFVILTINLLTTDSATSRFAKNNEVSSHKGVKLLQDKAHSVGWKNLLQLLLGLTALVCDILTLN